MADQTYDPRLETLLRDVLSAEVASLPLTVRPSQILERAEARRRARARSRLRLLIFGEPTGRSPATVRGAGRDRGPGGGGRTCLRHPAPGSQPRGSPAAHDARGMVPCGDRRWAKRPERHLARRQPTWAARGRGRRRRSARTLRLDRRPQLDSGAARSSIHRSAQDGAGWALVGSDRGFLLSNGDVWSSADGLDWQLLASRTDNPDLGHGEMLGVAAGGPGYVAVGNGNSAWYSTDGSEWSLAQVPQPPTQFFESQGFAAPEVDMRGIAVAGDKLVAWGTASRHTEDSGLTAAVCGPHRTGGPGPMCSTRAMAKDRARWQPDPAALPQCSTTPVSSSSGCPRMGRPGNRSLTSVPHGQKMPMACRSIWKSQRSRRRMPVSWPPEGSAQGA